MWLQQNHIAQMQDRKQKKLAMDGLKKSAQDNPCKRMEAKVAASSLEMQGI
jgi:hypothetical protein